MVACDTATTENMIMVSGDITKQTKTITEAELDATLKMPRAAAYLAFLEIDPTEGLRLFRVIDDAHGRISSEEFCT